MGFNHSLPVNGETIKARQRRAWSAGDYSLIGTTLVAVSEDLCEATDVHAGERVLDVAAGNGNTAIAAARRRCQVTGIGCVPGALEHGRQRAAAERLQVTFQDGDCENLPFADASFDIVLSTFGILLTAQQENAASEVLRVCRPGGKIGMANWTPTGFFGDLFSLIGRYAPLPTGLKSAMLWGDEERLRDLFGAKIISLQATELNFNFRYHSALEWLDVFGTNYGPLVSTLTALAPTQRMQCSLEVISLLERYNRAKDGTLIVPSEYLEVVARRR